MKKMNRFAKVSMALAAAFAMNAVSADELTEKAKGLIAAGKGAEAFKLLEPSEAARAGEVEYDFLLGLSALDAGQNTRAVFALERVLAMEPNNTRARAEIARAYLALGETKMAAAEFQTVQRQGIPADVSMTIDRYIAEARRIDDVNTTLVTAYVEGTIGYDSNVNAGPSKAMMALPGFGNLPFVLGKDSKSNADSFASLGAGANVRSPLGNGYVLLGGVSGLARANFSKDQFDTQSADANVGIMKTVDKDVFTVMAQTGVYYLNDDRYRNYTGLTGQWQRNLDARNQVGVFAQYSDLHYPTMDARDADRWVAGASYAHLYRDGVMAFASAYYVTENPQESHVGWLGFDGYGVRLGGRVNYDAQTTFFGGVTYERREYDKQDPIFLTKRKDNQYGLLFGATRFLSKDWSVTPQLSWTVNSSNTEINDYHRELVSVTLRREF